MSFDKKTKRRRRKLDSVIGFAVVGLQCRREPTIVSEIRSALLPFLVGVVVAATAAATQQPSRDQPRTPRAPTGLIRGRVVRADTGEPLRRVQVSIDEWSTGDQSGPAATMTDAQGRYELTELRAGRYQLRARRGGYVEVAYGQRRPFERGRPLELAEGAVLQNIDFALSPGAVVTGRIVDEVGDAVAQAAVSLARRRLVDGERRLIAESGGSTDDRGEFRFFGVPPGEYVIAAQLDMMDLGARNRVRYVPTYYPGTPLASEAQRVSLRAGQELSGITIALARAATATVRGVVRTSGQASLDPFTVIIARQIDGAPVYERMTEAVAASDGAFTLTGLLPGTYLLETHSMSGSASASSEVVVGGSDVTGITLMLSEGTTARGRIRFDTGKPPPELRPAQVFVMPLAVDRHTEGVPMSGGPPVPKDDWSFEVRGLRGRGFIRAAGALSDWRVKRVLREGLDVTDTSLDFSTDIDDLEIELTRQTTTVSGGVLDEHGRVALDATVIVFADDPDKWGPHTRFIDSARPDQQGRFTIRGLPPATYVAIAVGYLEPGEEHDPDLLEQWRQHGTRFLLAEGETHQVDLKLSEL